MNLKTVVERKGSKYILRRRSKSPCSYCKYRVDAPGTGSRLSQCRHPQHSRNGLYDSPFKDVHYRKFPGEIERTAKELGVVVVDREMVGSDEFIFPFEYNVTLIKECKGRK